MQLWIRTGGAHFVVPRTPAPKNDNDSYITDIDPAKRRVGWLMGEGGALRRMDDAPLSNDAARIAEHATQLQTNAAITNETHHGDGTA
jgi:hypothetical protein